MDRRAASYREFWPLYLAEHGRPATRGLHYLGTGLGLVMLAAAAFFRDWRLLIVALFVGYGFAWLGHAFVERNRPATFRHPLWSFVSDFACSPCGCPAAWGGNWRTTGSLGRGRGRRLRPSAEDKGHPRGWPLGSDCRTETGYWELLSTFGV